MIYKKLQSKRLLINIYINLMKTLNLMDTNIFGFTVSSGHIISQWPHAIANQDCRGKPQQHHDCRGKPQQHHVINTVATYASIQCRGKPQQGNNPDTLKRTERQPHLKKTNTDRTIPKIHQAPKTQIELWPNLFVFSISQAKN